RQTVGLEIAVEVPAGGPPLLVCADTNQLQQALVNLGLNARDAVPPPSKDEPTAPNIHVHVQQQTLTTELKAFPQNVPPGDYVLIEVRDRGCGMTPDVLAQAIDPFFTTKEVGQGTGLGLPVVFGIVQAHQGYLTMESAPGRGTNVGMY